MKTLDIKENEFPGQVELDKQIDCVKATIAADLKIINTGETKGLKILSLDTMLYKRVSDLLKPVIELPIKTTKSPAIIEAKPVSQGSRKNISDLATK